MSKQIPSGRTIREELKEWNCVYSRENGLHVWRDEKDDILAKGLSLADTARDAHDNFRKKLIAQAISESNQPEAAASEAPASDARYYVQQISDPYGEDVVNSWFVFDRRELDKNGVDTCKESNVSYRDAVALCDELNKSDSIMRRAHELREKLVYKHYPRDPSLFLVGDIPQPLAELEALRQQVAKLEGDLQAAQEKHAKDSRINLNLSEENARLKKLVGELAAYDFGDARPTRRLLALKRWAMQLVDKASVEAPVSTEAETTLTEQEIEWLANLNRQGIGYGYFVIPYLPAEFRHLVYAPYSNFPELYDFIFKYQTEGNRKVVERRRQELRELEENEA